MERLSSIIREQIQKPSPIRQIMKMAARENILAMGLDPEDVISFGGGWVNHPAPPRLIEVYSEIINDPEAFHVTGGYSPTPGMPAMKEALVRLEHEVAGQEIEPDNVIVGQSSTQTTHDLFVSILDPGDTLLIPDPSYANYPGQLSFAVPGAKLTRFPVFDPEEWLFAPDADSIIESVKDAVSTHGPKAVLFPAPDNPTSKVLPQEVVEGIADITEDAGAFLIFDMAYRTQMFVDPPAYYGWSPWEHENVIYLHSNSKWGRGLGRRLAWLIASGDVIDAMERIQQCTILCPDTLHQMALTKYLNEALDDGSLVNYLREVNDMYRSAAKVTLSAIDEHIGYPRTDPDGGLYTVMKVSTNADAFVPEVLKNTGVLFIPGGGFGPALAEGVRISYGPLVNDLERIEEGMVRVGKHLS
jgi:aspartate/methionine/tyrosine aminotransferase